MSSHYILESLHYEIRAPDGVSIRLLCCYRISNSDAPGVWLVKGVVRPRFDDTFEFRQRCIGFGEYMERLNRMHCNSLAVHPETIRTR